MPIISSVRRTGWGIPIAVLTLAFMAAPAGAWQVVDLPADDRPLGADFEEVFRIGSLDGEAWETFGEIGSTGFDEDGNLYVFDRQGNRIVKVDRNGSFVREIGAPGEGPGEFRAAMAFAPMRDGRLVVADIGHRAYQIFDESGEYERMVSFDQGGGMIRLGSFQPHPDGTSIVSGESGMRVMESRGPGGGGAPSEPEGRPIERVSLEGDVITAETLVTGWQPPQGGPTEMSAGGMQIRMSTSGPATFEPELLVGVLPDGGVVYADSSTYSLKVVDADGSPLRTLRRPFQPREVTERMQEAEKERRLAELDAGDGPQMRMMVAGPGGGSQPAPISQDQIQQMMRDRVEQLRFYPELPVLQGMASTWTGKIWVGRRGEEPVGPGPIDVLTPDGRDMGTFAPEATSIPASFGPNGLAAWVEEDDFGVPIVVVRRLPPVLN